MTNQAMATISEGKTQSGIFWRKTSTATSKDVLVLVMGYGGSLRIWPVSFIDKLASKYVVLTYDNRGTGLSFVPASPESYTAQLMAADLNEVVTELDISQFHLMGYSMGGCIALQYAVDFGAKVKTLFLLSSTAAGSLYVKPASEVSSALANPQGQTLWDIYMWTFSLMYSPEQMIRCEPQMRLIYENSKGTPTSVRGLQGHSNAFKTFDLSEAVYGLKIPTVVMTGTEDRLMPPENSDNLAKAIPNSKLVRVENCEHAVHVQEEARVIREIEAHCN